MPECWPIDVTKITAQDQPVVAVRDALRVWLPVAEAVEETAEDAAFAGKGRGRCGRGVRWRATGWS